MDTHEHIYAATYVLFYQQGFPPQECARRALAAADQAVALRDTIRPRYTAPNAPSAPAAVPATSNAPVSPPTPAPDPAPSPAASRAQALMTRFAEPQLAMDPAMTAAVENAFPAESVGPVVDTTAVEVPVSGDTLDAYIARNPSARTVIQDLRDRFGFTLQDR